MKRLASTALVLLLAVSFLSMAGCGGGEKEEIAAQEDQAPDGGDELLTAREALAIADEVAGDWASDAALVELSTYPSPPKSSGRGSCWKFEFNSLTLEKELEVYVRRGKFFQKMEGKLIKRDVISDGWIDSPEAIRAAIKHCSQKPDETYWFGLSTAKGRPVWRVKCSENIDKPVWVRLDAVTGEEL